MDLSQPARDLLLAMADGKELRHGIRAMGYWELDGKHIDATLGPRELQEKGLIHDLTLGDAAKKAPQLIRLTPRGQELTERLRSR
ncbi:MAG TPA: hypothetical protein VKK31_04120 [Thermoanaerobaculia bacterium]|nr:hypothetical protein [Thermoanaerobaculia bacterium]